MNIPFVSKARHDRELAALERLLAIAEKRAEDAKRKLRERIEYDVIREFIRARRFAAGHSPELDAEMASEVERRFAALTNRQPIGAPS